tara:strand:+ start:751 stop:1638 length:888 start_codon:yes stop_codon:yes gene_type:complete
MNDTTESHSSIEVPAGHLSGFVSLVGRPNVGKSTLLNAFFDKKIAIVSDKPQTTRTEIRGVLTGPEFQIVFCDTPGIHKPRTLLGTRLNDTARFTLKEIDLVLFVVEADSVIGKGDKFIAKSLPNEKTVLVLNKIDKVKSGRILTQLNEASGFSFTEYFPISASTGEGVSELLEHIKTKLVPGPRYFPENMETDFSESFWVAELVREQLLSEVREELPHSIATRVTEWDWPRIRCEILVERNSQKGIVIGHKGEVLKKVGTQVRKQLQDGAFIELVVKVEKDWQKHPRSLDRFGY